MITREQIMHRLKTAQLTLSSSRQNLWAADIPESRLRHVVLIHLYGDGVSRTVEIEKVEEDDTYTMKFDNVPVAPADCRPIPENSWDIEKPILVLEGGTNLSFVANAGAPEATVLYWDSEIS